MRSLPHNGNWPNLKGKKSHRLGCQCCVLENHKDRENEKEVKKEIAEGIKESEEFDER